MLMWIFRGLGRLLPCRVTVHDVEEGRDFDVWYMIKAVFLVRCCGPGSPSLPQPPLSPSLPLSGCSGSLLRSLQ